MFYHFVRPVDEIYTPMFLFFIKSQLDPRPSLKWKVLYFYIIFLDFQFFGLFGIKSKSWFFVEVQYDIFKIISQKNISRSLRPYLQNWTKFFEIRMAFDQPWRHGFKNYGFRSVPGFHFKFLIKSLIQYTTLEILHWSWLGVRTYWIRDLIRDLKSEPGTDLY